MWALDNALQQSPAAMALRSDPHRPLGVLQPPSWVQVSGILCCNQSHQQKGIPAMVTTRAEAARYASRMPEA